MKIKLIYSKYFWLGLIFLIGFLLRFYKLGKIPDGFVNDEANFGYSAYSLIKTGKDEFGQPWPFFFRSFGDGKLPVYTYLTIPFVLLFGLTEFAVRLPSALAGVLTVPLIYLIAVEISKKRREFDKNGLWPLICSAVLAFLPWHIHFSRAAFEANLGLFWISLGTWLFLLFTNKKKGIILFFSLLSFALSIFSYHAPRVFVPLWLGFLPVYFWKRFNVKARIKFLVGGIVLIFIPWFLILTSNFSLSRAKAVSIFHEQSGVMIKLNQKIMEAKGKPIWLVRLFHNKPEAFFRDFTRRYLSHFNFDFLFFTGDPLRPRYRSPSVGQALWVELPFFLLGLYLLFKWRIWLIGVWLLLAPVSSGFSFETPSSIRSLIMIAPFSLLIGLGIFGAIKGLKKKRFFNRLLILTFFIFVYNIFYYLDAYFVHAPSDQPYFWQYGYKELVQKINQLIPKYQKIEITDFRGTPYIYFLFYNQYDPARFQKEVWKSWEPAKKFSYEAIRKLGNKIYFVAEYCPAYKKESGVLYVCTEEKHPKKEIEAGMIRIVDRVEYQDGQPAFVLMEKVKDETKVY